MTEREKARYLYDWSLIARPKQLPPKGDWETWLIQTGRGWGKTRAGVEFIRHEVEAGRAKRIALVGPTAADVRDVIVEGESGILAVCPPWDRPLYEPSKRRLTWKNGAIATTYSADEPDRLRGPQHDLALADELAAWRRPEAWDMLLLGLRIGNNPRCVVMTTPRPIQVLRDLAANPHTVVTYGTTFENKENLAERFFTQIINRYEGTSLGEQEIFGRLLEELPGALWQRALIESSRKTKAPKLARIVIAVDPAVTAKKTSDETGIIVCGLGEDDHGYILEDLSGRYLPNTWGQIVVKAYYKWEADRIIAEVNQGGDMVETIIRTIGENIPYKSIHASRGKTIRAEPVAALYEQNRVHHVGGFSELEDQLCNWSGPPDKSPDRLDALVYAITELMLQGQQPFIFI